MAIPEDRQQAALREAAETITQTRAAVQAAAQVTPLDRAGGPIVVPVYLDGREIARATLPHQARELQLRGVTS